MKQFVRQLTDMIGMQTDRKIAFQLYIIQMIPIDYQREAKIVNLNKQNRDRDVIVKKKLHKQEVANRDGNSQYCLMYKYKSS